MYLLCFFSCSLGLYIFDERYKHIFIISFLVTTLFTITNLRKMKTKTNL